MLTLRGPEIFSRKQLSETKIVELTLRISLCGFFNRFNDALMIDAEAEALTHD